ncbi:hypothetical protein Vretifemale_12382, partial [Volvox reticuliferus]
MARKKNSQCRKSVKKRAGGAGKNGDAGAAANGNTGITTGRPSGTSKKGGGNPSDAGPIPNLFWGAVSMDELRASPRFVGLPECTQPQTPLPCPAAARYLRQDSPEWRQLHTGILTTGILKEALGLREPMAARVVGGRKESCHSPLLAAFQHLQQPPLLPPPLRDTKQEATWRRRAVRGLLRFALQRQKLLEQQQVQHRCQQQVQRHGQEQRGLERQSHGQEGQEQRQQQQQQQEGHQGQDLDAAVDADAEPESESGAEGQWADHHAQLFLFFLTFQWLLETVFSIRW